MAHTHFIGIGGTGLSAIARVLLERSEKVSGSDMNSSELTSQLKKAGAKIFIGHNAKNIHGADQVVYSSAIPEDNVEYISALVSDIPLLNRKEFFPAFFANNQVIGIAGTHGKTSTTSMTAWVLTSLGLDPGFIIGSTSENLGTNASAGESKLFVIEADEYDHMFWGLNCQLAVITNIEHDHPDCFPTPGSYYQAFSGFVDRIQKDGTLIICIDDPESRKIAKYAKKNDINVITFSMNNSKADYHAENIQAIHGSGFSYTLFKGKNYITEVSLSVPGVHNILNSIAVMIIVDHLYQDLNEASNFISEFSGSHRRFQILGKVNDIILVDDYGHHPTEIKTTLAGARAMYPDRRIIAVWEPHTYSRTFNLLREFSDSFDLAEQLIITKLYPARESKPEGFDPHIILKAFRHPAVQYQDSSSGTIHYLLNYLQTGDLLIVFSAGKAFEITAEVFAQLSASEVTNV
jgi:UDP-N-acetylmuramate--alanine ligase